MCRFICFERNLELVESKVKTGSLSNLFKFTELFVVPFFQLDQHHSF